MKQWVDQQVNKDLQQQNRNLFMLLCTKILLSKILPTLFTKQVESASSHSLVPASVSLQLKEIVSKRSKKKEFHCSICISMLFFDWQTWITAIKMRAKDNVNIGGSHTIVVSAFETARTLGIILVTGSLKLSARFCICTAWITINRVWRSTSWSRTYKCVHE